MRNLTLVSIAAAGTLALASVYLLRQVELERERADAETARRVDLQARVDQLEQERRVLGREHAGADSSSVGTRPEGGQLVSAEAEDEAPADRTRPGINLLDPQLQQSKMLRDPAGRDLLRAQERAEIQAANPHLARDLQLTKEEYERLLDLLVEQAMASAELFARMRGGIDVKEFRLLSANHDLQVEALLGYEKAQQYREYEASEPERRLVRHFRARLAEANALSDDQAARLAASWHEGRERFRKELEPQYVGYDGNMTTMGTWYGGEFRASELVGTPVQEQLLEQMEAYNRQLIDAAKSVLTPRRIVHINGLM